MCCSLIKLISIYLDDVITYSQDRLSHLRDVAVVFQALQDVNLTGNPKKFPLGKWETTYLEVENSEVQLVGNILVGNGKVQSLISRLEVLANKPTQKSKKQV